MKLEDYIDPAKPNIQLVPGFANDTTETVLIGGSPVQAFWMGHVVAQENDPLWILLSNRPKNPSLAIVIGVNGPATPDSIQPIAGTVTSAPIGSNTVTVSTFAGPVEAAFATGYSPSVSDKVRILWQGENAWVLGNSLVTPVAPREKLVKPSPNIPTPPGSKGDGEEAFTASDSATYSTGTRSWNSYYGKDVYQGRYGSSGNNRGSWFYHNKMSKLKGKKITKVMIWIPRRTNAGNPRSTVDVSLFLHSSSRRPRSDVTRGAGTTISIPRGFKGGWKELPAAWGSYLVGGNGVGMANGSYAGFEGIKKSKKSGQIKLTWEG